MPATKAPAKRGRPRKNPAPPPPPKKTSKIAIALCLAVTAALVICAFIFEKDGVVISGFVSLLRGLFGGGMYILPILLLAVAGFVLAALGGKINRRMTISTVILFLAVCGFMQMFSQAEYTNFGSMIAALYNGGGGGVIGGIFAELLRLLLGAGFTYVLLSLVVIFAVILLTGITFADIEELFAGQREKREEQKAEKSLGQAADKISDKTADKTDENEPPLFTSIGSPGSEIKIPAPPEPAKKKFAFDMAIDDNMAKKSPSRETAADPFREKDMFDAATAQMQEPKITKKEISEEGAKVAEQVEKAEDKPAYIYPPSSLLARPSAESSDSATELRANAVKIVETLQSFGVETTVLNVSRGPAVTRYELAPAVGVKISKITSLSDDIALALAANGIRIEAPIPGKAAVGIEVPNNRINTVFVRSLIEGENFAKAKANEETLPFVLGKDLSGEHVVGDISKMPHVLVAGATGSGKSVCVNSMIISLLASRSPDEVGLIMIDPKMVELTVYNGIPHLLIPVVTDPKQAAGALFWAVGEMERRYKLFAEKGVRDLSGYNLLAAGDDEIQKLNKVVIIIDELADLMMTSPKEVEDYICRLAQKARAAGMYLVIATQRPSVDVITGVIKANIPSRIALAVASMVDSRTILDMGGAEKLLGRGDMLFYPSGAPKPLRVQGCFVSDKEVEAVTEFVKKQGSAEYDQSIIEGIKNAPVKGAKPADTGASGDDEDDMFLDAVECVVDSGMASTSLLQRRLKLGYARAARIIDDMEAKGIVGPFEGSKPRQVKITREEWQEMQMRRNDAKD